MEKQSGMDTKTGDLVIYHFKRNFRVKKGRQVYIIHTEDVKLMEVF
jgi:hypothetical protein